jgi:small-conductance mechanosensitive channel
MLGADLLTFEWLKTDGVRIGIILVLAALVSWAGSVAVRRFRRRLEQPADQTQVLTLQRTATLVATLAYAIRIVVWTVALLLILGEIGIDLAPLIAGAGIAGIALGFGAQSLVKDFLAGFFILLENQYAVGEFVEISAVGATIQGRVEEITLRTTAIRAPDGTLSTIPNGNVQVASNKSRGRGRFTLEVDVPGGHDPQEAEHRLAALCDDLRHESLGLQMDGQGTASLVIAVETKPSRRDEVEALLRLRLGALFLPSRPS